MLRTVSILFPLFPHRSLMALHKLENYLRSHRRKAGLAQDDVAFLLGYQSGTQLVRFEKRQRVPSVEAALACEVVYGVPVAELFAGMRERIERDIGKRLLELRSKLQSRAGRVRRRDALSVARRADWLAKRIAAAPAEEQNTVA